MTRIEGDHAALLATLADRPRGRRRVAIEPDERVLDPREGVAHPIGTVAETPDRGLNGDVIQVVGDQDRAWTEGADFTREWRVPTDRGAFTVAYSVDRTPGNRTHSVYVSRAAGDDENADEENAGSGQ